MWRKDKTIELVTTEILKKTNRGMENIVKCENINI